MVAAAVAFAVYLGRTESNNNKGYLMSAQEFLRRAARPVTTRRMAIPRPCGC